MANIIRYLSLVLGYKGNRYRGYKWIPAILKPRGLVGIRGKKDKERRDSIRLSAKCGQ